jgi:hypothetical protein
MVFPVKVFTKICILQERKKKFEQNLGLRGRTTETTPQKTIQELQKRELQSGKSSARKPRAGEGQRKKRERMEFERQRCTSFMQSLVQAVFFLSLLPDCPSARSALHGRQPTYRPTYLPTYLPQGDNELVCNT